VDERVERVAVSVAGGPVRHARLRGGSRLEEVLGAVSSLVARRARAREPRAQVSFLATRDNARDLPLVVELAAAAGADEVYVTHLSCSPSPAHVRMRTFPGEDALGPVRDAVKEAAGVARGLRVAFRPPALRAHEPVVCAADPTRMAYVTHDGRVGPCVNLMLPIAGPVPRCSAAGTAQVSRVVYGRLDEAPLAEILRAEARQEFVAPFEARRAAEARFRARTFGGFGSGALRRLDDADAERSAGFAANPFPAGCAGCPEASGWWSLGW
jgi:MoaA/NifB/PqqE/SkfB family radical SAM enzyme